MGKRAILRVFGSFIAVGATVVGMAAVAPGVARAASPHPAAPPRHAPARPTPSGARPAAPATPDGTTKVSHQAAVKAYARERRFAAAHAAVPAITSPAKTFTVNTTEDSDLANSAGTTCVDASTGKCSLRAAVHAANNIKKPVDITLATNTYHLTTDDSLEVTNPGGTEILGNGSTKSVISGDDATQIFYVDEASSSPPGLLLLKNAQLTHGSASYGGALELGTEDGDAVLTNVLITHNAATSYGGGIYGYGDYLHLSNVTVSDNTAPYGGGLDNDYGDTELVNSRITGNTATFGEGGGLYAYYAQITMKGGSISGNSTGTGVTGYGGGIYESDSADIELSGVALTGNTAGDDSDAGYGGGVYLYYSMLDASGGSISQNTAKDTGAGGGVYATEGEQVGLHSVAMKGNTVTGTTSDGSGGGAVYLYAYYYPGLLTIDGKSTISGSNNAAVYLEGYEGGLDASISGVTFSGNSDDSANADGGYGCGGAVCVYNYAYSGINLTMAGNTLNNNTAAGDYGSGAVTVWNTSYGNVSTTLSHNVFSKNSTGAGGYGGAVGIYPEDSEGNTELRSVSNTFSNNTAGTTASPGYGGGLSVSDYTNFTDAGSLFSGNRALGDKSYGGGFYDDGSESGRLTGTKFVNNSVGGSTGDGYGGGLYADEYSGLQLDRVTISGNKATSYGAGVYDAAQNSLIQRSTISGNTVGTNTVTGYGGGIYADEYTLRLVESTVANNRAPAVGSTPGYGGGIYADLEKLDVRHSTISGNIAMDGGGIYSEDNGGTLLSSIVSGNHAKSGGAEQDCMNSGSVEALNSLGGNVFGQTPCVASAGIGDVFTHSPGLRSLGNYGGPTKTMALAASSPANGRGVSFCDSTDQRGQSRPSSHCSSGAYQRAAGSVTGVHPGKGKKGTKVTISGSGFTFARSVHFGSHKASFHVVSDHKITTRAPKGKGKVKVSVTTPDGSSKKGHFTYKHKKHHHHG